MSRSDRIHLDAVLRVQRKELSVGSAAELICPQAKGWVERRNGVFQDAG